MENYERLAAFSRRQVIGTVSGIFLRTRVRVPREFGFGINRALREGDDFVEIRSIRCLHFLL